MSFTRRPRRSPWRRLSLALLLALPATAIAAPDCASRFEPFTAEYDLYRNDDRLGSTTVSLELDENGVWTYELESEAEKGFIGLVGAGYREASRWMEGAGDSLMPLSFRREQHVAFRDRSYEAHFDWTANRAWGRARDREWQLDGIPEGTLDRLLVNLALIRDLRCDRNELTYRVLEKGELETWRFHRKGESSIETPDGFYRAVKVAKHHDAPDRVSFSWHAPALDWLAVRIEHQDDADEDRFAMVLRRLEK